MKAVETVQDLSPKAFSIRHVAKLLDISQRTAERYVSLKLIKVIRIGKTVRIPAAEIDRILKGE